MDAIDNNRQQGQARRLAGALLAQIDDAACAACLDELEAYVAAQLDGDEYAARWPAVATHLDACVACAESYALLYAAQVAERAQLAPATIPAPDLSFLQANIASPSAAGDLRAALGLAVARAGTRLRLTISRALLDLLPAPSAPALAFRSGGGTALFELTLDETGSTIERLNVSAYADRAAAERCAVRVQVAVRGREWPDLAGIAIALYVGDEQRTAATDAWGESVFADVPTVALARLVVEVDHG
jgi:hypothetical protein